MNVLCIVKNVEKGATLQELPDKSQSSGKKQREYYS